MHTLKIIIKLSFEQSTIISSLQVALVVGVILNIINQWSAIEIMNYHLINYPKLFLTFLVPYLVSTYATVKAKMQ